MERIFYRTVKGNQIKLLGKRLGHPDLCNGELDGKRFCFIPYQTFREDGITCLWGTEEYSKAIQRVHRYGADEEAMNRFLEPFAKRNESLLAPQGYYRWYFWRELVLIPDKAAVEFSKER